MDEHEAVVRSRRVTRLFRSGPNVAELVGAALAFALGVAIVFGTCGP